MNSFQAKQIKIEDLLLRLGHKPKKRRNTDLWYHSPLRGQDNTPSFKVNLKINTWYDFGLGEGGNIIDLACQLFNCDIKTALDNLERLFSSQTRLFDKKPSIHQPTLKPSVKQEKEEVLKLIGSQDISQNALKNYLVSRGISLDLARLYLKEVHFRYKDQGRIQYALAMENDSKDFEFRNSLMKGFLGKDKTITTLNVQDGNNLAVFEGFFDFLSYLQDLGVNELQSTVLIVNSTALKDKAKAFLSSHTFKKAYFFLDNDSSGKALFDYLVEDLPYPHADKSALYSGFNDYNEYLKSKLGLCWGKEKI